MIYLILHNFSRDKLFGVLITNENELNYVNMVQIKI